jgi:hypothetical protein
MQDGEAESYRNVEVEFVPGRQAKMTIYEDGVAIAGEPPIDMTLLVTKEDMHQLMVDKGFEKLTADELEVRKLEQSKLFPSSTSSTSTTKQKGNEVQSLKGYATERGASRRAAKEEKQRRRQRQKEDREILGEGAVPSYTNLVQLYGGAATFAVLVAVYAGVRRQRRRRPNAALRVGLSS